MIEPTGVAYEGFFNRGGGIRPGGHVVIIGAGPIGLAAIVLLKTAGAAKIINFEISDIRRKLAKEMGADFVYNPLDLKKDNITMAQIILEISRRIDMTTIVTSRFFLDRAVEAIEQTAKKIDAKVLVKP